MISRTNENLANIYNFPITRKSWKSRTLLSPEHKHCNSWYLSLVNIRWSATIPDHLWIVGYSYFTTSQRTKLSELGLTSNRKSKETDNFACFRLSATSTRSPLNRQLITLHNIHLNVNPANQTVRVGSTSNRKSEETKDLGCEFDPTSGQKLYEVVVGTKGKSSTSASFTRTQTS